jgi:hypothetical protein
VRGGEASALPAQRTPEAVARFRSRRRRQT